MLIEIELKTPASSLDYSPDLEAIKKAVDIASYGFKGAVVYHKSLYEYRYDTRNKSYNDVDTKGIVGHVQYTKINDNKLYIGVETSKYNEDSKYICFFRSRLDSKSFDIFAIDLIEIGFNETIKLENLSDIKVVE